MGFLGAHEEGAKVSRADMLRRYGYPVPMPDPPDVEVVGLALDIGLAASGPMGAIPLPSVEIDAWARLMGLELSPWEFRALRIMSRAYISGMHATEAPWDGRTVRQSLAFAKSEAGAFGDAAEAPKQAKRQPRRR